MSRAGDFIDEFTRRTMRGRKLVVQHGFALSGPWQDRIAQDIRERLSAELADKGAYAGGLEIVSIH